MKQIGLINVLDRLSLFTEDTIDDENIGIKIEFKNE